MKIELILHKDNGEIRRYPVYRLDKFDGMWTARYVILKDGKHEARRAVIDGEKARLDIEEQGEK